MKLNRERSVQESINRAIEVDLVPPPHKQDQATMELGLLQVRRVWSAGDALDAVDGLTYRTTLTAIAHGKRMHWLTAERLFMVLLDQGAGLAVAERARRVTFTSEAIREPLRPIVLHWLKVAERERGQ